MFGSLPLAPERGTTTLSNCPRAIGTMDEEEEEEEERPLAVQGLNPAEELRAQQAEQLAQLATINRRIDKRLDDDSKRSATAQVSEQQAEGESPPITDADGLERILVRTTAQRARQLRRKQADEVEASEILAGTGAGSPLAFGAMDKDGDGKISAEAFREALALRGLEDVLHITAAAAAPPQSAAFLTVDVKNVIKNVVLNAGGGAVGLTQLHAKTGASPRKFQRHLPSPRPSARAAEAPPEPSDAASSPSAPWVGLQPRVLPRLRIATPLP